MQKVEPDVVLEGMAAPVIPGTDAGFSLYDLCLARVRDGTIERCLVDIGDGVLGPGDIDQIDPDVPLIDVP